MSLLLARVGAPPTPDVWVPVVRSPALAAALVRASAPRVVLVGADPVAAPADVWAVVVPRAATIPPRLAAPRGVVVASDPVVAAPDAWVPIVSAVPLRRASSGLAAGAYPVVDAAAATPDVFALAVSMVVARRSSGAAPRVPMVAADPVVAAADAVPVRIDTPRSAAPRRGVPPSSTTPPDTPSAWAPPTGGMLTRQVRVAASASAAMVATGADDSLTWCPPAGLSAAAVVSRLAPYRPGRVAVTWPSPAGPVFDYVVDPFDAPAPAGTVTSLPTLDAAAGLLSPDSMLGPGVVLGPDGLVRSGAYSPSDPDGSSASTPSMAGYGVPAPAGSSASDPDLVVAAGLLSPDSMLGPGVVLGPDGVVAGGAWSVPAPRGASTSGPAAAVFSSSPSGGVSDAPELVVASGLLEPDSMLGPGVVVSPGGVAAGGVFSSPSPTLVGGP